MPITEASPTFASFLFAPLPGLTPRLATLISPMSPAAPTAASIAIIGLKGCVWCKKSFKKRILKISTRI